MRPLVPQIRSTWLWLYRSRTLLWLSIFVVLSVATACSQAKAEIQPPHIHYGEDICEFCNMIISEERFAAGYLTKDGQQHIFDDIGDLVQAHLDEQQTIIASFVHDHDTHTWIKAERAYYVLSEDLPTPMLSGLAAFSTLEATEIFTSHYPGQVLTFAELQTFYLENPPTPPFSGLNNEG